MQKNPKLVESTENSVSIKEQFERYLFYWPWFALALFTSLSIAFMMLRYSTSEYKVAASVLIVDDKKSGISNLNLKIMNEI